MSDRSVPADDDKRSALLEAARELFLKNSYANISIRRIADKAKVNSAMIAYYFGSKNGLFREMIVSYVGSTLHRAQETMTQVDQMRLQDFLANFYRTVPAELVHLVVRTMIYERSDMRDWLLDNLLRPALSMASTVAKKVIDEHGKPVDPLVLRTLMQSMLIGPKILQPVLAELHPKEINDEFYDQLALLNAQLIAHYFELEKK